jgi:periplasmic protein TonB
MGGIKPNSREQKPEPVITSEKMTSGHAQSRHSPRRSTTGNDGAAPDRSNIVLFSRPSRASAAPPLMLRAEDRPAPWLPPAQARGLMPVFLVCALALHAGLYALEREPVPVASIGELSIAVDILLGSQVTAGLSSTPSPSSVARPDSPDGEQPGKANTTDPAPDEVPAPPESATLEPQPLSNPEPELPGREVVAAQPPTSSIERKPPAVERKPPAVERKPPQKAREQRTKREASLAPAGNGRATPAATTSTPSSGVGRGRSDADSNYPGRVYAHLARHQQGPSEGRGDHGVARVTISLDGNGRVTGVRLTQSSGNAGFDHEAQAIVRRASPLPAPPSGRPLTLGWSVSFR